MRTGFTPMAMTPCFGKPSLMWALLVLPGLSGCGGMVVVESDSGSGGTRAASGSGGLSASGGAGCSGGKVTRNGLPVCADLHIK